MTDEAKGTLSGLLKHCQRQTEIAENILRKELGRTKPVDRWVNQAICRVERWRGWTDELTNLLSTTTFKKGSKK